jgi:hypothetical protein
VVGWRVCSRAKAILGIPLGNSSQEVGYMLGSHSARLVRLGRQIAGLEHARRCLPAGFTWTGDALIATLRAEKARLENLVAMPDHAGAGGSEPESEEEHEIPAAKTGASVEAGGPHCSGTEAMPDSPPEPEAATATPVEAATPRNGEPEENSVGQQKSAVAAEPASDSLPSDSGASDKELSEADVSDTEKLIAYIADRGGVIHVRALMRGKGKKGNEFSTAAGARAALQRLVDAGHGEWLKPDVFQLHEPTPGVPASRDVPGEASLPPANLPPPESRIFF